jgi:exo-beta-1,3-glucanase (GH17 family)
MTAHRRAREVLAVGAVLVIAAGWLAGFWRDGRAVALPDVPEGRLACLSYTPRATIPGAAAFVTPAQIEADLALLAHETRCVRTYSSTRGMQAVPEIARRHGIAVLQGIWIGRDKATNEAEIAGGLAVAAAYPDVVGTLIVGNEVLLRHEQRVATLYDYVARVNAATDVPVTYADVWEFWRTGAALAGAVDYVTIHILPYWENDPVGVTAALEHVRAIRAELAADFPDKDVAIGETGWPTRGRQREGARPSLVNGARFVREFVAWANSEDVRYNVIEAFDQPWKRGSEGTVGGYWGLFDVSGAAKFPLTGPVVEDPRWTTGFVLAGGLAIAFVLAGLVACGVRGLAGHAWMCAVGLASGAALYAQWRYVPAANRDWTEFATTAIGFACGWIIVLALAPRIGRALYGGPDAAAGLALTGGVDAMRSSTIAFGTRLLSILRLLLVFGIAYLCLGLALDPRYRDFPLELTVLPATLLALHTVFARGGVSGGAGIGIEERMLAATIVACAVASAVIEGPRNLPALAWNGSCLVLGLALLRTPRTEAGEHQRREQDAGAGRVEAV